MSKARDLSNFISVATVDATEMGANSVTTTALADLNVTHAKLHTDMNLSSKTLTLGNNQISGNAIDGGVISNFASTGIDDNSSATAVTILSDGKVGIGTGSPSTSLDIVRNGVQPLRVQSTSGTEVEINMVNTGGNVQLEAHNGNFNINADNVGIGTASPQLGSAWNKVLHVHSSGGVGSHIRFTDVTSGETGESGFYIGQYGNDAYLINRESGFMALRVNGTTDAIRITSSGNVGIGTTSPSFGAGGFGLELAGAAGAGRPTIRIKDTVTNNALQLSATATAAILESRSAGMDLVLGTSSAEKFRIDDSSGYLVSQHQSQVRLVLGSVGNSNNNSSNWIRGNASYLQYNSAASGHTWEIAGSERMRIHSSGKVLINAIDPQDDPSMLRVFNSMSNLGGICLGKVHNSTNNNNAAVLLHKMGQGQGFQFSGKFIVNSWTGNRHIDCHITSYYTNDSVSVNTNSANSGGVSATTVRLCTVNIGGVLYLAFVKNGGGSGVSYLNAFIEGNIHFSGGIQEVLTAGSGYTVTTTHHTF